jgi:hypothetical protein
MCRLCSKESTAATSSATSRTGTLTGKAFSLYNPAKGFYEKTA